MKKCMQQGLSVLMALCLLCAVLPLGGMMSVSADVDETVNLISNPGFEATDKTTNYWTVYSPTAVAAEAAHSGSNGVHLKGTGGWGGMLVMNEISVLPFCEYTFSFWYNIQQNGVNYSLKGNQSGTKYAGQWLSNTTGWQKVTVSFLTGDDTTLYLNFNGGGNGIAESVYVDDFSLNLTKRGFAEPVKNGDFEEGHVNGWSSNSTIVAAADCPLAPTGNYAMQFTNSGYGYTDYKMTVKPNTDYVVTYSVLSGKAKYPLQARVRTTVNTELVLDTFTPSTTAWERHTLSFNSGNNTSLLLRFQNGWAGGIFYIDDIYVESVGGGADSGTLPNGGFETGDTSNWTCRSGNPTIVEESHYGRYALQITNPSAWGEAAIRTIAVKQNTNYQVSWWAKRVSGTGTFNAVVSQTVSPWAGFEKLSGQNYMNETSGEWVKYTCVYNSGTNTQMLLKFTTEAANAGSILLDDVSVIELTEVSTDGLISNGNFECGGKDAWTAGSSITVCTDAAKTGNFGIYLKDSGSWAGLLSQTFPVVEGRTYRVSFDYLALTNGVNFRVADPKNSGNSNKFYGSKYLNQRTWSTYSQVIRVENSGDAAVQFVGAGNALETNVFVDNIQVVEIPDTEVNLLEHGGKSAMEMDEAGAVGGLGFLFSANINAFTYTEDNNDPIHKYTVYHYEENSGIANPYTNTEFLNDPYDYTVVRVGAIVSNKLGEVVDTDLTIENAVSGTGTINIVGSKAMKELCDDTHYVYGVRVTNIPESAFGRTIYARPYITILIGGEEVTLYGDTVSASYEHIMGGVA